MILVLRAREISLVIEDLIPYWRQEIRHSRLPRFHAWHEFGLRGHLPWYKLNTLIWEPEQLLGLCWYSGFLHNCLWGRLWQLSNLVIQLDVSWIVLNILCWSLLPFHQRRLYLHIILSTTEGGNDYRLYLCHTSSLFWSLSHLEPNPCRLQARYPTQKDSRCNQLDWKRKRRHEH